MARITTHTTPKQNAFEKDWARKCVGPVNTTREERECYFCSVESFISFTEYSFIQSCIHLKGGNFHQKRIKPFYTNELLTFFFNNVHLFKFRFVR